MGKVNISDNFDLAGRYNVSTIPRVLIFKGGDQPLHLLVGLTSERELTQLLDRVLQP